MLSPDLAPARDPGTTPPPAEVPVFILCGGQGTRLGDAAALGPKPMLEIGEQPMLIHIMRWYERFGFRRFVLCTGHKSEVIGAYFSDFLARNADFTIDTRAREITYHQRQRLPDWVVTVAHTGGKAMTGARVARAAQRYLGEAQHFAVTYGDGLTDADLGEEYAYHAEHGRIGTVLGVHPPSQFGRFELAEEGTASFVEKPQRGAELINGGYFFFRRDFLDYLATDDDCVLEREPLSRLTGQGELAIWRHGGFWSCVDTIRDRDSMRGLWDEGVAPWR